MHTTNDEFKACGYHLLFGMKAQVQKQLRGSRLSELKPWLPSVLIFSVEKERQKQRSVNALYPKFLALQKPEKIQDHMKCLLSRDV